MGTVQLPDLQQQVASLKATVADAAAHPFLPPPARRAMAQAAEVIDTLATRLGRIEDLLGHQLQVMDARIAAEMRLPGPIEWTPPTGY